MSEKNREIQELLVDYAEALRDGSIPTFLKSLTREEAMAIITAVDFWQAAEIARILNDAGFADKAPTPNVGLFISRLDAEIASRSKKTGASARTKRSAQPKPITKFEKKTEKAI